MTCEAELSISAVAQFPAREWDDAYLTATAPNFYQHVGLYAYRRDFLLTISEMPRAEMEKIEKLEQLRVLNAGYSILVGVVDEATFGIDTPGDYQAFVKKLRASSSTSRKE